MRLLKTSSYNVIPHGWAAWLMREGLYRIHCRVASLNFNRIHCTQFAPENVANKKET